jgi:hypothetical protein
MLERAKSEGGDGPKAPEVRVLRAGGRLRVEHDVTNRKPRRPHARRDGELRGRGPQTVNLAVHSGGHGKVTTPLVLDLLKRLDVHTSARRRSAVPPESTRDDIPPFGADTPALTLPQPAADAQRRVRVHPRRPPGPPTAARTRAPARREMRIVMPETVVAGR